jgi:hypothetical protein
MLFKADTARIVRWSYWRRLGIIWRFFGTAADALVR